jgi:hypothetical protein
LLIYDDDDDDSDSDSDSDDGNDDVIVVFDDIDNVFNVDDDDIFYDVDDDDDDVMYHLHKFLPTHPFSTD